MKFYMDVDYIRGHLRYGHYEGEIDMDKEAEKEFKFLLKKDLNGDTMTEEEFNKLEEYKEWIEGETDIIVDDYEIDEIGECCWRDLLD